MKHLFFDLDRTLWDFEANSEKALELLFDEMNLSKHMRSFQSFHTTYKKINAHLWFLYSKNQISKDLLRVKRFRDTFRSFDFVNDQLADELAEAYVKTSPHLTQLFPHTKETLNELKNSGYSLHIITNGFREVQSIKLEKSGLIDYFDIVVCSEDIGYQKPSIHVFNHALKQAKSRPEESVMIGDSIQSDVIGAENAGIKAVLFDPNFQYKEGTHKWMIRSLKEIPELLPWIKKTT